MENFTADTMWNDRDPLLTVACVPSLCFPSAGTLHQRGTALPGSSGKHRGGHSLRGGWSDQQLPAAPQLWQGDQREAEDMAFLAGEEYSMWNFMFVHKKRLFVLFFVRAKSCKIDVKIREKQTWEWTFTLWGYFKWFTKYFYKNCKHSFFHLFMM